MINKCPYCNSERINKNGYKCNKQRYNCRDCRKYFCEKYVRVKRLLEQRELCLRLYANNMPMRRIQRMIEKTYYIKISFNLIDTWIKSSVKRLKEDIAKEKEKKENNKERKDNINDNKNTINILEVYENKDRMLSNESKLSFDNLCP